MAHEDASGHEAPTLDNRRAAPARRLRRAGAVSVVVAGALAVAFAIGFVRFASSASAPDAPAGSLAADGIVVFTGGQDRINQAIALLDGGAARRLLISGVHPHTTKAALAVVSGGREDLFGCCIDLDRSAMDTIGNADETAAWAHRHGFGSLIVVTSGYHMERSLTELGRALPDARLEGYPVATQSLDLEHWWRRPRAARLLLSEYVKLLAARSRSVLASGAAPGGR